MITGVTLGFRYKMRLVYNHFPIKPIIKNNGTELQIQNYLGGAESHTIKVHPGVKVSMAADVKDQMIVDGIDINAVSLTCSLTRQVCKVGKKDERKFLDGIYINQKTTIEVLDE